MESLSGDLDYPMVIVTAAANGERSGCLIGFHTQCSIDPLQWAVWISKANHTWSVARDAAVLAVHFPSVDDTALAELFGETTGDEVDKFTRCDWTPAADGVPLLDGLPSFFVGRVVQRIDAGGDHECFVLAVDQVEHGEHLRQLGFQAVRDFDPGHPA